MKPHTKSTNDVILTTALVVAFLCCCLPAAAILADRNGHLGPLPKQTQEQINQEMTRPVVTPPVQQHGTDSPPDQNEAAAKALASGPGNTQPLEAMLAQTKKNTEDQKSSGTQNASNYPVGIAIAAGLVGLICIGGMVAVKKGSQPPGYQRDL